MKDHSFLDGDEWVLRTRVSSANVNGFPLTHDAAIPATHDTRAKWNAHFWSLFPENAAEFAAAVRSEAIVVSVMFRFRPTIRMKDKYDGHPVLKVARVADNSQLVSHRPPTAVAGAVEAYERDKRRLDEQRKHAWTELIQLRLPTPPIGYQWDLVNGDPRSFSDVLTFGLRAR